MKNQLDYPLDVLVSNDLIQFSKLAKKLKVLLYSDILLKMFTKVFYKLPTLSHFKIIIRYALILEIT